MNNMCNGSTDGQDAILVDSSLFFSSMNKAFNYPCTGVICYKRSFGKY